MGQGTGRGTLLGAAVLTAVLVATAAVTYWNIRRLGEDAGAVAHTHEVMTAVADVRADLGLAGSRQRTYLIGGEARVLDLYREAADRLPGEVEHLRELTADNPAQQDRLPELAEQVRAAVAQLTADAARRNEPGFDAVAAVHIDPDRPPPGLRALALLKGMDGEEERLLADRLAKHAATVRWAVGTGLGTVAAGLGVVGVLVWQVRRHLRARERAAALLHAERELLGTTLASIGDAVIATDTAGRVTFLNPVAELLTGWSAADAAGRPLADVFRIVNESTRAAVDNPAFRVLAEGVVVGLANHTLLIARDGTERPIDDSAAPIRAGGGALRGAVLVFRDISDRKAADRREQEARDQVAATLESITDGFMRLDREWRLVYVNDEAERMNRRPRADTLGRVFWDTFPATAGTRLEAEYRRAVADRVTVEFENHYAPFDRWFAVKGYPTPDGGLSVYFRDVTERKRADGALRASEARNAAIVGSALDAIVTMDHHGNVAEFNAAAEAIFGYRRDEAVGKAMDELIIPPPYRDLHRRGLERYLATGEGPVLGQRLELPARRADGSEFPAELTITRMPADGPPMFTGFIRDIGDRKRAEERLRLAEEQFRTLAESIPQLAWSAEPDGSITWYNRRWYEYTGTTAEQMAGWGWQAVHDPAVLPAVTARWRESLADGTPFDMTFPLRGADGAFRPFLTRVEPVKDDGGRVVRWFGTNTDVSEQQRTADELRRLADELSAAARQKDDFLALLAHELRNPLAPIRNGLQVLRLTDEPDARRRAQGMMDRQLAHMVRLIDDLLDVSRISRNKMELRKARITLADAVAHAVETARPVIDAAGHELTVALPPQPVVLDADLTRLAQVFANLLTNSAKYTPRGGRIRLSASVVSGQGPVTSKKEGDGAIAVNRVGPSLDTDHRPLVTIQVTDTGLGIPADALPRIFDMFSQVDRSVERDTGGLGIGLALVKGLVEMHGGAVAAESPGPGGGSTFTVRLPAVGAESGTRSSESKAADDGAPSSHSALRVPDSALRRVLVVDDNRDSAESMAEVLRLHGDAVELAHDGLAAVAAVEAFRPHVVLMDVGMPHLNGLDATRRIREHPWGKAVRIVALTGWGQDADREQSRAAGCDAHLVKPVGLHDLLAALGPAVSGTGEAG